MKKRPHTFVGRFCHWPVCTKCGMLRLKNKATEAAIKKGCSGSEKEDGK